MLKDNPDVVEDRSERQFLLAALALAVTAQVESKTRHVGLTKPGCEPGEEAAFLAGDTAAVDQNHSTISRSSGDDEGAGQVQAVESAKGCGSALDRHMGSCRLPSWLGTAIFPHMAGNHGGALGVGEGPPQAGRERPVV